jgi:hypothetical protein
MQFASVLLAVGLGLGASGSVRAQEAECAPVAVGEGTGVYFLALGESCTDAPADGYALVAHLVRDDDSSEVLVLVDAEHTDAETQAVAQVLTERVKDGTIDGGTWHVADEPSE